MMKPSVSVFFSCTPGGERALAFASDLARLLSSDTVTVCVPGNKAVHPQVARLVDVNPDMAQSARVGGTVVKMPGFAVDNVAIRTFYDSGHTLEFPPQTIVVDARLAALRADLNVLVPLDERGLQSRGRGPLLVPFGDGTSGVRAGRLAVALAAALGHKVVFYHSTWKNPAVSSTSPEDHMIEKAAETRRTLEGLAAAAGVEFETLIETAADVVEGTILCAMRSGANLIVMARGLKTIIGSYVDKALEHSPVPLLIAADERSVA